MELQTYLSDKKALFNQGLQTYWQRSVGDMPMVLREAIEYSLFSDGKRIRPILVFASAELFDLKTQEVMPLAIAIEMVHVFSLIHDDLPCMDDDDYRRGQPTNHKVFGEAKAVLAGDALLAEAVLPILSLENSKTSSQILRLLFQAVGGRGMIAGQILDMDSENQQLSLTELQTLHSLKTGALIEASVLMPAILAEAPEENYKALLSYAKAIGLAFQIVDDVLESEGAELGKDKASDEKNNKSTYPKILGLEKAKNTRDAKLDEALQALQAFDHKADALRNLARFIVQRNK